MDIWNIASLGLKPLYEKNYSYYKIVREFREKLPRAQNRARTITHEEIDRNPFLPDSMKYVHAVDVSTHKINVSEVELDLFYNRLNDFDYSFMFFRNHYRNFTKDLNRLNPKGENKNIDIVVLQDILQDDPLQPLKPFDVLVFHLKWEIKITSTIYKRFSPSLKKRRKFLRAVA